jgi:hypothetical protein
MRSSGTAHFCKLKSCPSAETLLLHEKDALALEKRWSVRVHLNVCDFCAAEFQLLVRHAPATTNCATTESATVAAPHLQRLAEDILGGTDRALASLIESFYEKDPMTFTDA